MLVRWVLRATCTGGTLEHQPPRSRRWKRVGIRARRAALFAIPDETASQPFSLDLPRLNGLVLTHSLDGSRTEGLEGEDRRRWQSFFFRHHGGISLMPRWWRQAGGCAREAGCSTAALLACLAMAPLGLVVLAGWTAAEVGRSWTVYGLMRTADSTPPSLTGDAVLVSLLSYMIVYLIIFPAGAFVMARIVRAGPADGPESDSPIESGRPSGPVQVELRSGRDKP
jgi:cytochrome d ubiquinol oxidase subunit I